MLHAEHAQHRLLRPAFVLFFLLLLLFLRTVPDSNASPAPPSCERTARQPETLSDASRSRQRVRHEQTSRGVRGHRARLLPWRCGRRALWLWLPSASAMPPSRCPNQMQTLVLMSCSGNKTAPGLCDSGCSGQGLTPSHSASCCAVARFPPNAKHRFVKHRPTEIPSRDGSQGATQRRDSKRRGRLAGTHRRTVRRVTTAPPYARPSRKSHLITVPTALASSTIATSGGGGEAISSPSALPLQDPEVVESCPVSSCGTKSQTAKMAG